MMADFHEFSWYWWLVCILILMMEACLGCVAMSCRVFWSTVRSFFTALLLFERLVILLLANSTTSRGQESWCWVGASLACILLVLPNQIFYTTHQWLPLASDNKFHSKWSKMLLLDSSRKINHLCNLFNDLF